MRGHFAKAKVTPKARLAEFRVSEDALLDSGTSLSVGHFVVGQYVDVCGTSIGKGFAGAMSAGLQGPPAMVCRSRTARTARPAIARIPARCSRARRWRATWATAGSRCRISRWSDRPRTRLILVKGVPGARGGYVRVTDAIKRALPQAPYPAGVVTTGAPIGAATMAPQPPARRQPAEE